MVYEPSEYPVVLRVPVYAEVVSSEPIWVEPMKKETPATPILSDAVAERGTDEPETVVPVVGEVRVTVGLLESTKEV